MPTVVTDRFTALDYTDFTNNHVFVKSCSNGLYDYNHHGPHAVHDGRKLASAKQLIGNALRERVENIDYEFCEPGDEDTFFVADLGEVYRQHLRWKLNLPRVRPFYGKNLPADGTC
jgi:ornithine decarboxylase